jgi:hypothetical protein
MGVEHLTCKSCKVPCPDYLLDCPTCGDRIGFPNVNIARRNGEKQALSGRYEAAIQAARANGSEARLNAFQTACEAGSVVMCCPAQKLIDMANGTVQLYATFYDLLSMRLASERQPGEPNWNLIRCKSEMTLFGDPAPVIDKVPLHYAVLSLDGKGLSHYGGQDDYCEVELRVPMIENRASLFETNLGVFYDQHRHDALPPGMRAEWADRGKLCVAKLAQKITRTTSGSDFPTILMELKGKPVEDQFVEVHVYGDMTLQTFRRVKAVIRETRFTGAIPHPLQRVRSKRGQCKHQVLRDKCKLTVVNGTEVEYEEFEES